MRHRELGSTGMKVCELALGTGGLSGEGYGDVAEGEQDALIDRALATGISLFETADTYASGKMESRLGRRLPKEGSVFVATKIGTAADGTLLRRDFGRTHLREAALRSRERLDRECIDVLLLHNPSAATVKRGEATAALAELVSEGVARAWGVSSGTADVSAEAVTAGAQVVEVAYNAFHTRDYLRIAPDVKDKKVGILARSVLAYGLLCGGWPTTKEFPLDDHRSERWSGDELKRRIMQLNALRPSVSGGISGLRAVALRYVLSDESVSSAVLGPRKSTQLDQLVRDAGKDRRYLPEGGREMLEQRVRNLGVKP
jgi:aryl-alcohol dehydrogenase-like predicted oxidoreductase